MINFIEIEQKLTEAEQRVTMQENILREENKEK